MTIKFMNKIFDKHEIQQEYRDYIFGTTNDFPQNLNMSGWNDILKALNEKIELTNKSMIRIYDLLLESSNLYRMQEFLYEKFNHNNEIVSYKMLELLLLTKKLKIEDILYKILRIDSYHGGKVIAKYLFDNYKNDQILKTLDIFGVSDSSTQLFVSLLRLDYSSYIDITVDKFKKSHRCFEHLNTFLPIIKDEKIIKELTILSLIEYFSSNLMINKGIKLKAKDIDMIEAFLNGKKDKKFDKLADSISKSLNKNKNESENEFYYLRNYNYWALQAGREFKDDFFINLRNLYLSISQVRGIKEYIFEYHISVDKLLNEYKVPMYRYLYFLMHETAGWSDKRKKESIEEITTYVNSNFKDLKLALKMVGNKIKMSVIRALYDKNTTEFSKLMVEMAVSASSKTLKDLIIEMLEKDKENKGIVINLLEEKKSHAREIGVTILTKWNLPDTKKIIKPLLKSEKNKSIIDLISNYLATL